MDETIDETINDIICGHLNAILPGWQDGDCEIFITAANDPHFRYDFWGSGDIMFSTDHDYHSLDLDGLTPEEACRRITAIVRMMQGEKAEATGVGGEEIVTSPTGGQKGRKPAELMSIDPLALLELARVSGMGARKYDTYNYLRGYAWTLSANALMRHLLAFMAGQDRDPESGHLHAAHAAWHALALTSFALRGIGEDDRFDPRTSETFPKEAVQ